MGALIPNSVKETDISLYLETMGLNRIYQGKTRDMYDLGNNILTVASDRLSIFDFVLSATVPLKGEVLTALTYFWLTDILKNYPHHLVDSIKYQGLNATHDLMDRYPELPLKRSLVIKKINILPYELIFRHHIGGSVYKKYLATEMAGGQKLTSNLPKWSKLKIPIFTPSTKEESGHDINIDATSFTAKYGNRGQKLVDMYRDGYQKAYAYAEKRGILILDTKFEGNFFLFADEVLTPDSSRFCDADNWRQAMKDGQEPAFLDKQIVRAWGETVTTPFNKKDDQKKIIGLKNLDPTNIKHVAWVHKLEIPGYIINETTKRYLAIFKRLTGYELYNYQNEQMKIVA